MSIFYLHGIQNGATFLSELSDLSQGVNSEQMTGFAAGHAYPLFRAIRGQTPSASFSSGSIGTILDLIAAGGNKYAVDLSGNVTDILYRRGQDVGIRYGLDTLNHQRFRMAQAFMFWDTISAAYQQDAQISCQLIAAYDGTNSPVVRAGSVAAGGTPAASEFYTLGPLSINGNDIGELQNWSLASGAGMIQTGGGGDAGGALWPTYTAIEQFDQVLTLSTNGIPWADLAVLTGTTLTSDLVFYLRKKAADGTYVSDATEEHIKFTVTKGQVLPESVGGVGIADSTVRIALRAPDADTATITIDTTSAIT